MFSVAEIRAQRDGELNYIRPLKQSTGNGSRGCIISDTYSRCYAALVRSADRCLNLLDPKQFILRLSRRKDLKSNLKFWFEYFYKA